MAPSTVLSSTAQPELARGTSLFHARYVRSVGLRRAAEARNRYGGRDHW
jgi:hypothetical protein